MADRTLTWFVKGVLSNSVVGQNVAESYVLDDDYVPVRVHLTLGSAADGELPLVIDINLDGSTIFGTKPSIGQGFLTQQAFGVFLSSLTTMDKDSVVTLDVDQVPSTPGSDMTVSLELDRA